MKKNDKKDFAIERRFGVYNMPSASLSDDNVNRKAEVQSGYLNNVLRNSLDSVDPNRVCAYEAQLTVHTVELARLRIKTIPFEALCSLATLQTIHATIFECIYPHIAGSLRIVDMAREECQKVALAKARDIQSKGTEIFKAMRHDKRLTLEQENMTVDSKAAFIDAFGRYYLQLYKLHSFREGNTRALGILFNEIAERAGFKTELLSIETATGKNEHKEKTYAAMGSITAIPDFIRWLGGSIVYSVSEKNTYNTKCKQSEYDTFKQLIKGDMQPPTREKAVSYNNSGYASVSAVAVPTLKVNPQTVAEEVQKQLTAEQRQRMHDRYDLAGNTELKSHQETLKQREHVSGVLFVR